MQVCEGASMKIETLRICVFIYCAWSFLVYLNAYLNFSLCVIEDTPALGYKVPLQLWGWVTY